MLRSSELKNEARLRYQPRWIEANVELACKLTSQP